MKNIFKKFLGIAIAICMVLSLVACGGSGSTTSASNGKVIKVGVFEPQTGDNGGGGYQEVLGIRYANEIYNKVNINGEEYEIKLVEVDNKSDKTEAVNAAQKLIGEKVSVVLGSYGSGVSIAAGDYFRDAKIPAIGCSCTNPQVTNGNPFYFRSCFLDPFQGTVMANYVKNQGFKKAAVIMELGDDYSTGLGNFFIKACEKFGIEVVAKETFQKNAQDFRAILTNIKAKDPEFIFAPSSIATAPLILSQARELGIECVIGGGDTWENGTIIDNAHGAAEGMIVTTFYDDKAEQNAEGKIFLEGDGKVARGFGNYLVANGQPNVIPAVSALGYDSYIGAYKAIEKAQSLNGEDIRAALVELAYDGVTGAISYDEQGDARKTQAYIKTVKNGEFVFKEITTLDNVQ